MTRWARGGNANKKKAYDGTTWSDLSSDDRTKKQVKGRMEGDKDGKSEASGSTSLREASARLKESANQKQKFFSEAQDDYLAKAWRKEKRSEFRRVKRIQQREDNKICYNCRGTGHTMSECTQAVQDMDYGTGICFKCGSTEHNSASCTIKLPSGVYPYAKCFICEETGHISKQCPDNPRGLYPKGGCCKICTSVEHFMKDCPELQKQQGISDEGVPRVHVMESADAEPSLQKIRRLPPVKKKGPKLVKF